MELFNKQLFMPQMYADGIQRGNDKTFIIYQKADGTRQEYSYAYIEKQAQIIIDKLNKAGIKKGERIAVVSSLRPWWYAINYAALKAGYIMVCIDPGVPSVQMQNMMLETEVRAVFTSLNKIHLPSEINDFIPVYAISEDFPLMSKCEKVSFLLSESKPMKENTFYVLFSSGTTGERRKAVLLDHQTVTKGIEYGMAQDAGIYKNTTAYTPRQRDLMLFPPYHIAGLLCATYDIYCNTQVIMLERLTPNSLVTVLQDLKPDNICTVPSMLASLYKKILAGYSNNLILKVTTNWALAFSGFLRRNFGIKAGRFFLKPINKKAFGGNMKGFMIGASSFDEVANRFFLDMGIDVSMAYGLTELGAPLATTGQGYYPGTTGRVIQHNGDLKIRIVNKDENGRGEVEILSPYRMISYLNDKDNEGCFSEDGYFKSGDLGYFDKNNCLVICGRIKESIVLKNGEKLLPEEIEEHYQNLDCVKDVVAFKVAGENNCDDFSIALVGDPTKGIQDEALKVRVYDRANNLPQMYRPKDVYIIKELPLSSSHKVQRFRLTQMVQEGLNNPVTDSSMITIDEDATTAELRKMLVKVGGSQWKNENLTQGLLLNLDSLATVNLYVEIQEKWNIDLFQTAQQPVTFGELLDTINSFNEMDKKEKSEIDLSQYPLKATITNRLFGRSLGHLIKTVWSVKPININYLPKNTNYIMCSNHVTELDPAYISSCLSLETLKKTCIVGKAELVENKLLKQLVISHNFIPIDRTGNSIKTLERCKELLLEGYNILIFPEGTNVPGNKKTFPLKEGAARIAIATNKPIVPIHLVGFAEPEREMGQGGIISIPSFKGKVSVIFGKPILPENKTVEEINDILSKSINEL